MNNYEIKISCLRKGLDHYRKNEFYEAHEAWEDLWSDYNLEDKNFIQGLIQLSVSFVHLGNNKPQWSKEFVKKM